MEELGFRIELHSGATGPRIEHWSGDVHLWSRNYDSIIERDRDAANMLQHNRIYGQSYYTVKEYRNTEITHDN